PRRQGDFLPRLGLLCRRIPADQARGCCRRRRRRRARLKELPAIDGVLLPFMHLSALRDTGSEVGMSDQLNPSAFNSCATRESYSIGGRIAHANREDYPREREATNTGSRARISYCHIFAESDGMSGADTDRDDGRGSRESSGRTWSGSNSRAPAAQT